MNTGRPKTYEEAHVLTAAMHVFWQHGYRGTNYDDLVTATGLGRQSLYHAFGDKSSLFRKALDHYSAHVTQGSLDVLCAEGSPVASIRNWLERLKRRLVQHRNGCLLTNTAVELAPHEDEFSSFVSAESRRIEAALKRVFQNAIELGELSADVKPAEMATYLFGVAQGLMVLGRSGASASRLNSFVQTALTVVFIHKN